MGTVVCQRFVLLVAVLSLWVGRAHAATVAILRPSADSAELGEALFRLQGELLAVGVTVAVVERPDSPDTRSPEARAWFERTADSRGFDAFIDVVGGRTLVAVDVWIWERSARRFRVSRVLLEPRAQNAAATAAIRAIEVLRSSMLILDLPQAPAGERPAPPEPAQTGRAALATGTRFGIAAGAAALTSLDGVGASVLPLVRFEWSFASWLAPQATAAGFGTRPRVSSDAGSVAVDQQFALLGLCACPSHGKLRPVLSLSAGLLHTELEGRAAAPNMGHRVEQFSLLVDISAGLRLGLSDSYYLAPAAHLQLAEPQVTVHIVDTAVASTGRPNLLLALTLGAWL